MSNARTSKTSAPPSHAGERLLFDVDSLTMVRGGERVIDRVSLCVHAGEFVGLIGPNGAGKTTLLKAMLGLLPPTSGRVSKRPSRLGYIPQGSSLYSGIVPISVLEVVSLGSGASPAAIRQALSAVQVAALADKRFSELSAGQQQRVIIAKALAGGAAVLVLDEPTTGIDEQSQAAFYNLLRSLQEQGITIIMVSHEVDTVLDLVTRVICLNQSVLYDGPPEHFQADTYLPPVFKAQHRRLHHRHKDVHAGNI